MSKAKQSLGVIHNFFPSVPGMSDALIKQFQKTISHVLIETFEMKGAFVIANGKSEALIYSKSIYDFSKIQIIADLITSFDQAKFFKAISGPNFKQIDYLNFEDYQLHFIRLTEENTMIILFGDDSTSFEKQAESIVEELKNKMNSKIMKLSKMIPLPKQNHINPDIDVPLPKVNVPMYQQT